MPTFRHGSKAKLFWNGYDVSAAFKSANADRARDTHDTSGFGVTAKTYIGGLRDGTISADGMFDTAAAGADVGVLAAFTADDPVILLLPTGDAAGSTGDGLVGTQTAYTETAAVDDVVQVSAEAQSRIGVERVTVLHAFAAESLTTSNNDETSVDAGASSAVGASAYLQVGVVTGAGTATITVQDSDDDSTFVDLVAFDTISGTGDNTAQRKTVTGTVERYVRTRAVSTGTNSVEYLAAISRNPTL